MRVPFAKYEGLGNDFVIIEAAAAGRELGPTQAVRICDRHRGVGADGVLLLSSDQGRFGMKVINADGSIPEMCGNGIRCVALHLARTGLVDADSVEITTDAGPHVCRVLEAGAQGRIEVSMRAPSLRPDEVPVIADTQVIEFPLALDDQVVSITAVSMGNPHAVTFADVGERRFALGPLLQRHPCFPKGVNAGFGTVLAPQVLELFVFERGAGWTEACGTGACAAAVAAVETKRAARHLPIEVRLPGGALSIVVGAEHERLLMTGPARHVFDGTLEL